jgi:hypothetical protein
MVVTRGWSERVARSDGERLGSTKLQLDKNQKFCGAIAQ